MVGFGIPRRKKEPRKEKGTLLIYMENGDGREKSFGARDVESGRSFYYYTFFGLI